MTFLIRICASLCVLSATATQSLGHEFWLEPKIFQSEPGSTVEINLRNGEDFRGIDLSWYDPRIQSARVIQNGKTTNYEGLPGDLPAMSITQSDGLTVVAYAARMARLTYDNWDKVLSFATHKDAPWLAERHAARGLPQDRVTEGYWRFSKTLLSNGAPTGADMNTGMVTEFIARSDPYASGTTQFTAQLLYNGEPRTNAQVEMWEKSDDDVTRSLHRTDDNGLITLPVRAGFRYMIDAVVIREPQSDAARNAGVMWESLWANMTFAVPE